MPVYIVNGTKYIHVRVYRKIRRHIEDKTFYFFFGYNDLRVYKITEKKERIETNGKHV